MGTFFLISFFCTETPTPEIYTLSLHDALPICRDVSDQRAGRDWDRRAGRARGADGTRRRLGRSNPGATDGAVARSEEHTSELQSPCNLVCRLLLEKKKTATTTSARVTTCTAEI